MENYIAAALAGEDDKAAEYAYPDTAVAAQTKDMREALQGRNIRIVGICIGEWNSLAISSVIQADGMTGSIVFHLKKMILDQKVHWLIDDIDLETLDTIEREITNFLSKNLEARTIIARPQGPTGALMLEGFYSFGEGEIYSKRLGRIFNEAQHHIKQISAGYENKDWNDVSEAAIQVRDIFLGLEEAWRAASASVAAPALDEAKKTNAHLAGIKTRILGLANELRTWRSATFGVTGPGGGAIARTSAVSATERPGGMVGPAAVIYGE